MNTGVSRLGLDNLLPNRLEVRRDQTKGLWKGLVKVFFSKTDESRGLGEGRKVTIGERGPCYRGPGPLYLEVSEGVLNGPTRSFGYSTD